MPLLRSSLASGAVRPRAALSCTHLSRRHHRAEICSQGCVYCARARYVHLTVMQCVEPAVT